MIKIFVESGVNDARQHGKRTTNEQDFIEKVISLYFPKKEFGKDYLVVGVGGWTNLPNVVSEFKQNTDDGGNNLVVFDADTSQNSGGFIKRKEEIEVLKKQEELDFGLFLWPENCSDGDFEMLLSQIINEKHRCLLDCFEKFEKDIRAHDPKEEKYITPGRKAKMYTYLDLHKKSGIEQEMIKKGFGLFNNSEYWNLNAEAISPLVDFFARYFGTATEI